MSFVVPCFLAFFDLLISLGEIGLMIILHLKRRLTFSKWPQLSGVLLTFDKIATRCGLNILNIEKETSSTKSDVALTCKSQNAYFSGIDLPL